MPRFDLPIRAKLLLGGFAIASLTAIYLGFLFETPDVMLLVQGKYGYQASLFTFGFLLLSLAWTAWTLRQDISGQLGPQLRRHAAAIGVACVLVMTALTAIPPKVRILSDESDLLGTALVMHETGDNIQWSQGLYLHGQGYQPAEYSYDKRAPGYPFLLSLLHDATGYRIANAYGYNAVGGVLILLLVYSLALSMHQGADSRRCGLLALVSMASFPVLWYSISSAGFETWNLVFILAGLQTARLLDRQPRWDLVVLLVAISSVLGQFRYESIVFTVAFALFAILKMPWRRLADFPWLLMLAPLALVGTAWQVYVPFDTEVQSGIVAFSFENFVNNANYALLFFLNLGGSQFSSPLIISVALLGLLFGIKRRRRISEINKAYGLLLILSFLVWTCVVWSYWHGNFQSKLTMRLCLPLLPLFAVVAGLAAHSLIQYARQPVLFPIALLAIVGATMPAMLASQEQIDNDPSVLFNRVASLLDDRYPGQNTLLVSSNAGWFSALKVGSVTYASFANNQQMFMDLLKAGHLRQILLIQLLLAPDFELQGEELKGSQLPKQTILVTHTSPSTIIRIARLIPEY